MKKIKMIISFVIVAVVFGNVYGGESITVAVAANLVPVMNKIKSVYEAQNPGTTLTVIPGSSGKIATQIANGAKFDIFASADVGFPEKLKKDGFVSRGVDVYAVGYLALFSASKKDFSGGLKILTRDDIKKIAIANPDAAPYGRAAVVAMKASGVYDKVKHKFVFAENIGQAAQMTVAAADVGFVAKSYFFDDAVKGKYSKGVNWVEVDRKLYDPIKQGSVILKGSENKSSVRKFYDFFLSSKAKELFAQYGYN